MEEVERRFAETNASVSEVARTARQIVSATSKVSQEAADLTKGAEAPRRITRGQGAHSWPRLY
jgi:methyl-accepting chemotaxis protein